MKLKIALILAVLASMAGCVNKPSPEAINSPVEPSGQPVVATSTSPTVSQKPAPTSTAQNPEKPTTKPDEPAPTPNPAGLPSSVLLKVPFGSQAPFSNWDELHGEACEEASMIMVDQFLAGKTSITPHTMEQEILDLVEWETKAGYKIDSTADEVVTILKKYFNISSHTVTDVSLERIKQELANGKPIIIPAAGRLLGNPNFTGEGPIYHMLVLRGYDDAKKEFITNDPGTRKGEQYRYKYSVFLNAIHDWDHGRAQGGMTNEEIAQGRKVMIVID